MKHRTTGAGVRGAMGSSGSPWAERSGNGQRPEMTREGHMTMTASVDDAMAQIARLRDQMEGMMRDKVAPAVDDALTRASATSRDAAEAVRGSVGAQPLTAVLVAAAVGYLLGRVAR